MRAGASGGARGSESDGPAGAAGPDACASGAIGVGKCLGRLRLREGGWAWLAGVGAAEG